MKLTLIKLHRLLILVFSLFFIIGCASGKNWQGSLDCNMSDKEIVDNIVHILMEEGYSISSQSNDYIVAFFASTSLFNANKYEWSIKVTNNRIIAIASVHTGTFVNNVPIYNTMGENTAAKHTPYWRVRRKIEKLCDNQMIIINTFENKEIDEFRK
jgi:hypothetical protein